MNEIVIREFKILDAAAVSNIIRDNLIQVNRKDYPEKVIDYMYKLFTPDYIIFLTKTRQIYVAVCDKDIVGTAGIAGDTIYAVYVGIKSHGQGIGRKLMSFIEQIARQKGNKSVKLPASITARKFYEKLGYSFVKEQETEEFGRSILMEKQLI